MSSHSGAHESRRRFVAALATAGPALALRAWGFGQSPAIPASKSQYPPKVVDLVERSLVIDMLAPLKLDFTPAAFSGPFTEADAAMFRSSGITGFHNSIGVGGASAYDDALSFIAAWSGFVGRNADVFALVGKAEDIDRA
jgi:membrane dipeptidase